MDGATTTGVEDTTGVRLIPGVEVTLVKTIKETGTRFQRMRFLKMVPVTSLDLLHAADAGTVREEEEGVEVVVVALDRAEVRVEPFGCL